MPGQVADEVLKALDVVGDVQVDVLRGAVGVGLRVHGPVIDEGGPLFEVRRIAAVGVRLQQGVEAFGQAQVTGEEGGL